MSDPTNEELRNIANVAYIHLSIEDVEADTKRLRAVWDAARAADAEEIARLKNRLLDWEDSRSIEGVEQDDVGSIRTERDALAQQIAAVRAWLEGCGDRIIPNGVQLAAALSPVTPESYPLPGHWSNGDPVHLILDGKGGRRVAPNLNGAQWVRDE